MDEHGCPTGAGGEAGRIDTRGDVGVDVGLSGRVALDFGTVLDAGVTGGAAANPIFGGDEVVNGDEVVAGDELVDGESTVGAAGMVGGRAKAAAAVEPSLSALYHGPPVSQIAKTNKKAAVAPTAVGILQDNDPSRC